MTTYSISLDDVDLALLPLRTHKYNDFLKKEHFEFQVMKTSIVKDTEPTEPTVLYICHVCDIEVPAAFAREHTTSIKHRANARIASVAAKRTSAFITALPPPTCAQPTARFCENCATVVDEDHDKTKEHRVAVMHDRLLWDLMKAYVQEDYDELIYDDQKKGIDDTLKKNHINVKNGDGNDKNRVGQDMNDNCSLKLIEKKTEHTNIPVGEQVAMNCQTKGDLEKHKEDKTYKTETNHRDNMKNNRTENIGSVNLPVLVTPSIWLNTPEAKDVVENGLDSLGPRNPITNGIEAENGMKHKYEDYGEKLRKLIVNKDSFQFKENANLIHIKINDDTINIFSDNFHSYDRMYYSGRLKCIVCDCLLNIDDAEDHKNDSKHMRKIINLGNDDHHVREIDESHSHCILCNLKIKNSNVDTHKQLLLHIVRKGIYSSKTNKTQDAKNDNIIQHGNTENDKNTANGRTLAVKEKHKEECVVTKKTNNIIVRSEIEYPYKVTAGGQVRCVVCKCQVPNGVRNREEHIKGSRHQQAQSVAQDLLI